MRLSVKLFIISGVLVLSFNQCVSDKLDPALVDDCATTPTYDKDIRPIIDNSCAYSGCHIDSAPGVFASYAGLQRYLVNGEFRSRVINLQADPLVGMPPNNAPNGKPKDLTAEELKLITCWLQAGFPE